MEEVKLYERKHTSSLLSKTWAQPLVSTSFPQGPGVEKGRSAALLAAIHHLTASTEKINGDTDSMSDQESEKRTKLLKTRRNP